MIYNYETNLEYKLLELIEVKRLEKIECLIRGGNPNNDEKIRGYINALSDFKDMINLCRKKIEQQD
jgi:hypothetical protein